MLTAIFAGIQTASVSAAEAVYNFSELTNEQYAGKNKTEQVFGGKLTLGSTSESAKPHAVSASAAAPGGGTTNFTSALLGKQLAVTVTLEAGETLVEYYTGSDSKYTNGSNIDMQIVDLNNNVVADEANNENDGLKPYSISYTSQSGGTYTVRESSTDTVRTVVFAVIVTKDASFAPGGGANPSETSQPGGGAATAEPTKIPAPNQTADPSGISDITIQSESGDLENAAVTWKNTADVDKYNVYYKKQGGEYVKLDDELVRLYPGYYRADAMGISAGTYTMKIEAVIGGKVAQSVESGEITVLPHRREGFAFKGSAVPGGYNADGTPKSSDRQQQVCRLFGPLRYNQEL